MSRRAVLSGAIGGAAGLMVASCDTPGYPTTSGRLDSSHVTGQPAWRLAVPTDGRPRGLVLALHGLGGDVTVAFDVVGATDHVDRTRLAIVSVDGGTTYWHRRKDGTDTGAMVMDDLMPLALQKAGLPDDAPVATWGWSMGGFGALHLAAAHPQRISVAVGVAAALFASAAESAPGAFDDAEDFEENDIMRRVDDLKDTPVLLECGTSDSFLATNQALAKKLADVETRFGPGGHNGEFFRSKAGAELDWIAERLA